MDYSSKCLSLLVATALIWTVMMWPAAVCGDDLIDTPAQLELPEIKIQLDKDLIDTAERKAKRRLAADRAVRPRMMRFVAPETVDSAVTRGLKWLARHQREDGCWCFSHTTVACTDDCRPNGKFAEADPMATGIVLLAFLGAGQTHQEGTYKANVKKALVYLVDEVNGIVKADQSREEQSGEMGVAIAALVLTEAFAMTADKMLVKPAQAAIDHIVKTQDRADHGWRIYKMEPCSVELTAWQLMALKSAHMANLEVPLKQIQKTGEFLDSIQHDGGAKYGFGTPNASATAAALLSRAYLGWGGDPFFGRKDFETKLNRGLAYLSKTGPQPGQLQYNFFAQQLLRHRGDREQWKKWNDALRDQLVESQVTKEHAKGNWHFDDGEEQVKWGGRIYCTAMAVMILEVYYRHMPIYRSAAVDGMLGE